MSQDKELWQVFARKILRDYLKEAQGRRPKFSLRSMAIQLKVSPGALSDFLKGGRSFSENQIEKIFSQIKWPESYQKKIRAFLKQDLNETRNKIPHHAHKIYEHWESFAILSYLSTGKERYSQSEILSTLGIDPSLGLVLLDLLYQEKMIVREGDFYFGTQQSWTSSDEISSESIMKGHLSGLTKTISALKEIPSQERDFTSLTIHASMESLPELKKEIRQFYHRISIICEKIEKRSDVLKISVQLFPLTKNAKSK